MYNHYFSNFGRPPVPDDLNKDSAPRHPGFWRRRFLKVFTIYGHGGHLGQQLIVLGFNNTSTLVGHFVSSPREREKRDRRDSRGDERDD